MIDFREWICKKSNLLIMEQWGRHGIKKAKICKAFGLSAENFAYILKRTPGQAAYDRGLEYYRTNVQSLLNLDIQHETENKNHIKSNQISLEEYEDNDNLLYVINLPANVNYEQGKPTTYSGEYTSLIPTKRQVKALENIVLFLLFHQDLHEIYEDDISALQELCQIMKSQVNTFLEKSADYYNSSINKEEK